MSPRELRAAIDSRLAVWNERMDARLSIAGSDGEPFGAALRALLTGGKRLRPEFCAVSWLAHGGDQVDMGAVIDIGVALELFQAAALLHDDVMDGSDTRRGAPSAHRRLEALHRSSGLAGSSESFGTSGAILLGDLALVMCDEVFASAVAPLDPAVATAARDIFDTMKAEVTIGQYLDLVAQVQPWGDDPVADEARAMAVIRSKSAGYSVAHPVAIGAVIAGASEQQVRHIHGYGLPIGEAFQLRDDILGVFGDPAATGKPAGDDLREGKRTVLVARAVAALAGSPEATLLTTRLGDRSMDDATVAELAAIIRASGAVDEVETLISERVSAAAAAIATATISDDGRAEFARLAAAAASRAF